MNFFLETRLKYLEENKKVNFGIFQWHSLAASIGTQPPLLVQRCNGTTAGLVYWEVLELSKQILLLGQWASVRTVNSQWGRRIELLY
jgi:hypothetical protein